MMKDLYSGHVSEEDLMNYYEKVMIIDQNIDDSTVEDTVGKIRDLIAKQGGEVLKTENWGRRKLAYELNKHQKGNYIYLFFKSGPTAIVELERFCKVTDPVIKFMVVKITKKKQIEALLAPKGGTREAVKPAQEKTEPPAEEKKNV